MIKQNFIIDELEKKRILNLHESRTKNLYLIKEENGLLKTDFPPCVQLFGEPKANSDGKSGGIDGGDVNGVTYNWTGYRFFANFTVKKPDGNMDSYFCKGDQPALGQKLAATTKGKTTTSQGLGGAILKVGSTGDAVKQVQNRVVNGGHGDGQTVGGNANCGKDINSCDGKYGRGTMDAVMKFQTSAKVTSDGVVGDETWQQLFGGQVPVKKSGVRQSTTNTNEQIKRIALAFCSTAVGSNGMNIAAHNSKWDNKPFADYAKEVNASDEEIIAAAKTCPNSSRTKIIAKFLKDPSKLSKQVEYSTHVEK